jgi:tetratricopeptide (TPR) repeat protein
MAQATRAPGAEGDKVAAKAHYEAATRLYDIKEWARAIEEYKAAYLSKPDPAFLFNIGQCYRKLGRQAQALEFYKEFLKKAQPDDPNRPNVEARVSEMESGDLFADETPNMTAPPPTQPLPAPVPETRPLDEQVETQVVRPAEPGHPMPAPGSAPARMFPPNAPPVPAPSQLVQPAGLDVTVAGPAAPAESGTHFYKTWWFWTGVGAVVAAGTVVGILAASGGSHGNTANTALGTQAVFQ